jgi:hypothetical protein
VSLTAGLATGALALLAAWFAGAAAASGVIAGGLVAIANLWWLSRRTDVHGGRRPALVWVAVSARLSAVALVVGALLVTGWAHPLGLVAGLSVLPPVLVVVGLRDARIAS